MTGRRLLGGQALRALALAVLVFAMAWVSIRLSMPWRRLPPIWLSNAVWVAVLLRADLRRWPLLLAAGFLGNFVATSLLDHRPVASLGLCIANLVETSICAWAAVRIL